MAHRFPHPSCFTANLQAQYMDVWYEAFSCRLINFKTMFQSASKHAIFIQKLKKICREWAQPPPQIPQPGQGGSPSRTHLDHRTFGAQPRRAPFPNPKYATDLHNGGHSFNILPTQLCGEMWLQGASFKASGCASHTFIWVMWSLPCSQPG